MENWKEITKYYPINEQEASKHLESNWTTLFSWMLEKGSRYLVLNSFLPIFIVTVPERTCSRMVLSLVEQWVLLLWTSLYFYHGPAGPSLLDQLVLFSGTSIIILSWSSGSLSREPADPSIVDQPVLLLWTSWSFSRGLAGSSILDQLVLLSWTSRSFSRVSISFYLIKALFFGEMSVTFAFSTTFSTRNFQKQKFIIFGLWQFLLITLHLYAPVDNFATSPDCSVW